MEFNWDFGLRIIGRGFELSMSVDRQVALKAMQSEDIEYVEVWRNRGYVRTLVTKRQAEEFVTQSESKQFSLKVFKFGRSHS